MATVASRSMPMERYHSMADRLRSRSHVSASSPCRAMGVRDWGERLPGRRFMAWGALLGRGCDDDGWPSSAMAYQQGWTIAARMCQPSCCPLLRAGM